MNDEKEPQQTADKRGEKDVPPPCGENVQTMLSDVSSGKVGTDDEQGVVSDAGKRPFWKRRAVWIVVIVVVAIGVAGAVGVETWSSRVKNEALSDCRQYTGRIRKLKDASLGNDANEAAKVEKKDVVDAKTWETLQKDEKRLTDFRQKKVSTCDATSRGNAQKQQNDASAALKSLKTARADVEKSAKAVLASRDAKILKDTRDGLTAKVGQAKQLLDSFAGNVADDAMRTALSQQIDAANGLLGNEQSKLPDLQQASQTLDASVNGVNASVQAKADVDAAAAAAVAAATQAEAKQKSASGRAKSSGVARGGSSGYRSRSPAASPPQIHGFAGSAGEDHGPGGGHHDIMCFGPNECLDRNGNQLDNKGNIISGN